MTILRVVLAVLSLWIALVWHISLAGQSLFLGHKPDLTLIVVCLVAIRVRPAVGAGFGFLAGMAQGGAAGANLTALAVTRTLLGFASAFVARAGLQFSPYMAAVVVLVGTVCVQILFMIMAPPPDIGRFLAATLVTAIYNGVLAGLIDALLRRTLDPRVD